MKFSENLCKYLVGLGFVGIPAETVDSPGVEDPSFAETLGIQEEPPPVRDKPGNGRHAPRQGARLGGSHAGQGGVFRRRGAATGEASTPLGIAGGRMLGHWLVPSHHTFKLVCILLFYDAPRLEIFRVRIRG